MATQSLPLPITPGPPGTYATVIVMLPSRRSGGAFDLGYRGTSVTFDISNDPITSTSVMAWYEGVSFKSTPSASGAYLALIYHLVHPLKSVVPQPGLAMLHAAALAIRHILLSREKANADGEALQKLAIRLSHTYSLDELSCGATDLIGPDVRLYDLLSPAINAFEYGARFVTIEMKRYGTLDRKESAWDAGRRSYARRLMDDSDDSEDSGYGMDKVEEEITVEFTVDVNGHKDDLFQFGLEVDQVEEMAPSPLWECDATKTDKTPHRGEDRGTISEWFRHSFLLLWPPSNDIDIRFQGDTLAWASERFIVLKNADSSKGDTRFTTTLLDLCAEQAEQISRPDSAPSTVAEARNNTMIAVGMLSDCAIKWYDPDLWVRTVQISGAVHGIDMVGRQRIIDACDMLGFDSLENVLSEMAATGTASSRLAFLAAMEVSNKVPSVATWCVEKREAILQSLPRLVLDDVPILVDICETRGTAFIQDVLLPQLAITVPTPDVLKALITGFRRRVLPISTTPASIDSAIMNLISSSASTVTAFASVKADPRIDTATSTHTNIIPTSIFVPTIDSMTDTIELCLAANAQAVLRTFIGSIAS